MIEGVGFEYQLRRTKRRTLGVEVNYRGEVTVTAPDYVPLNKIEELLLKRKDWVVQKIEEKSSNLNILPKRQFISGEALYLFGKQYYLKIRKSNDFYVEKELHRITFFVKELNDTQGLVENWIYDQLDEVVKPLWESCLRKFFSKYSLSFIPDYKLKSIDKRWGSCTEKGSVHLNTNLVAAPVECIEYVIFHELTHLIVPSHNKDFYKVLVSFVPNYEKLRDRLNKNVTIFYGD